jgi:hypothetical protein
MFSSGLLSVAFFLSAGIAYAQAPIWTLVFPNIIIGISGNFFGFISAIFAFTADVTDPTQRSNSFGVLVAILYVGGMLAPIIGGFVLKQTDFASTYLVFGCMMAFVCLQITCCLPESLPLNKRTAEIDWWRATIIGNLALLWKLPDGEEEGGGQGQRCVSEHSQAGVGQDYGGGGKTAAEKKTGGRAHEPEAGGGEGEGGGEGGGEGESYVIRDDFSHQGDGTGGTTAASEGGLLQPHSTHSWRHLPLVGGTFFVFFINLTGFQSLQVLYVKLEPFQMSSTTIGYFIATMWCSR